MIHISQVIYKPKTIVYWRNPTKYEIKYGYGAIHYRYFSFNECFDENGYLKKTIISKDDTLKYFYS